MLGLVTPAISDLGKGAGKMLLTVIAISYVSTICSGFFTYGGVSFLYPHYINVGELSSSQVASKTFEPFISLKIPPLCDVLTALVLSFMIGDIGLHTRAERPCDDHIPCT